MQSALEGSRCLGHPCSCRSKYIGSALGLWCGATHSCNPRTFLHARTSTLSIALTAWTGLYASSYEPPTSIDPLGIWRSSKLQWLSPSSIFPHGRHRMSMHLDQYHRWFILMSLWFLLPYGCSRLVWPFPIPWRRTAYSGNRVVSSCSQLGVGRVSINNLLLSALG